MAVSAIARSEIPRSAGKLSIAIAKIVVRFAGVRPSPRTWS